VSGERRTLKNEDTEQKTAAAYLITHVVASFTLDARFTTTALPGTT
jgi:hypothetical protein